MPLGKDNMGGTSANRVTDVAADSVGGFGGDQSKVIPIENLPDHTHDLSDGNGTQYYAVKPGIGTDPVASAAFLGSALDNSGFIQRAVPNGTFNKVGIDGANTVTLSATVGLSIGNLIRFNNSFQNIVAGTVYFIRTIETPTTITISASEGGTVFNPGTGTAAGTLTWSVVNRQDVINPYTTVNYIIYTGQSN
jgi:hypothetical protein